MTFMLFLVTAIIACELCGHSLLKDFPWLHRLMPHNRFLVVVVKFFLGGLVILAVALVFLSLEYLIHLMES